MEVMAIGAFVGGYEDPERRLKQFKGLGIGNVQLSRPAEKYLSGGKAGELKEAIQHSGLIVTTIFCGFEDEDYADIPTVRRTVGYVNPRTRAERVEKSKETSDLAKFLGIDRVAAHIGFIPEDPAEPLYVAVVEAVRKVADYCRGNGQRFALETGQETASVLLRFIHDVGRDNLTVNFDPANMIIYGSGEPISALRLVADYVDGVHCKDATWPTEEGQLGCQVTLGRGDVAIEKFIKALKEIGYNGPLTVEREIAGEQQMKDIMEAIKLLKRLI